MCFEMHYLDLLSFIDSSEDNYAKDRFNNATSIFSAPLYFIDCLTLGVELKLELLFEKTEQLRHGFSSFLGL